MSQEGFSEQEVGPGALSTAGNVELTKQYGAAWALCANIWSTAAAYFVHHVSIKTG